MGYPTGVSNVEHPGYPDLPSNSKNPLVRWWEIDPSNPRDTRDRAMALVTETAAIEMRQSTWHETNLWNASLYTNRELVGFRWGTIEAHGELIPKDLRTESLVQEIGEAMVAKASSSPLKPTPVPHGKSYKVERAVRKLDWFSAALWRAVRAENASVEAFLDSYLSGLGTVRINWDPKSKSVTADTVFFDNVIVDNRECANRARPRHYRLRQVAPRSAVEAMYGIDLGQVTEHATTYVDYRQVGEGWVVVVEAWRLPDSDGRGGRHVVASAGHLLLDEEWTHPWVPLVFFHWTDPVSGFFPRSGVELIVPFQMRMNQLNDAIEESQDIACRPRILKHAGTNLDVNQWDNEAGRILDYTGQAPTPLLFPTNLGELYQERERVRQMAHAYMGLSVMTSQADMPPQVRLDSSAGVREFRNMEDFRHLRMWTRFEDFRLEIAKKLLVCLAAGTGSESYTVMYHPGGTRAKSEEVPYKEIKQLAEENYSWTMDAAPLSTLSPAVRRETIRDFSSRGLLQPGEERRMEGNPNLERIEDLEMASYDDVLRHLRILEEGDYEAPSELTNVTYGIPRVTQNYHRLKDYDDVDQGVLDNHEKWIAVAVAQQQDAINKAQEQQMAQAAAAQQRTVPFAPSQGVAGTNATTAPNAPHTMVFNQPAQS